MLKKMIEKIAAILGVSITVDSEGAFVLPFSDKASMRCMNDSGGDIVLSSVLGYIDPSKNSSEIYYRCLTGNLLGRETDGSVLGVDAEHQIIIQRRIAKDIAFEDFKFVVEAFMNSVEAWMDEVSNILQKAG